MKEDTYQEMLYRAMSDDGLMARIMSEAPDNSKGDDYDESIRTISGHISNQHML